MHLRCIADSTSYQQLTALLTLKAGQFFVGLQPSRINATAVISLYRLISLIGETQRFTETRLTCFTFHASFT